MQNSFEKSRPESQYTLDECRKLGKVIVVDAIRLYCESPKSRKKIINWIHDSNKFNFWCSVGEWNEDEIINIFTTIDNIGTQKEKNEIGLKIRRSMNAINQSRGVEKGIAGEGDEDTLDSF